MTTIELPYPPALNSYYRNVTINGAGRTLISAKGRAYTAEVARLLAGCKAMTERLAVSIEVYPPDLRRRDLDGTCKCLLDSLTKAGFWADDELIDDLRIIRRHKVAGGKVVLTVLSIS